MTLDKLKKNKTILILGYGVEGKATEEFLRKHLPAGKLIISDQRDGTEYLKKQKKVDLVIKTPGIPKRFVDSSYTTATNIFFANVKGRTIGVTGSKGKSTTTSLIHSILKIAGLKTHLAGNIGDPLLSELLASNKPEDIYVCELSSYQLDDIQHSPHISVFLNIFPDHMPYHGDFDAYFKAKAKISQFALKTDFFVYNPKFKLLQKLAEKTTAKAIPFIDRSDFDATEIRLKGRHNQDNIRAALTVARILDIPKDTVSKAIKKFAPLPHRLELVGTFHGITFYDDAASTTPESTIAALESLDSVDTLLLGGEDRGYDFSELAKKIVKHKISNVVLFPNSGKQISMVIKNKTKNPPHAFETRNMREAVSFAYTHTKDGSICLLSTASPSYSLWENFREKGDLFQRYVKKYSSKK